MLHFEVELEVAYEQSLFIITSQSLFNLDYQILLLLFFYLVCNFKKRSYIPSRKTELRDSTFASFKQWLQPLGDGAESQLSGTLN